MMDSIFPDEEWAFNKNIPVEFEFSDSNNSMDTLPGKLHSEVDGRQDYDDPEVELIIL